MCWAVVQTILIIVNRDNIVLIDQIDAWDLGYIVGFARYLACGLMMV
jgi:hypothetical protein